MALNQICFMLNTKRKRQWTLLINRVEMYAYQFCQAIKIYEISCENGFHFERDARRKVLEFVHRLDILLL